MIIMRDRVDDGGHDLWEDACGELLLTSIFHIATIVCVDGARLCLTDSLSTRQEAQRMTIR